MKLCVSDERSGAVTSDHGSRAMDVDGSRRSSGLEAARAASVQRGNRNRRMRPAKEAAPSAAGAPYPVKFGIPVELNQSMSQIPCAVCSEPVAIASQLERDDYEVVPLCESCRSHFHPITDTALAQIRGRATRSSTAQTVTASLPNRAGDQRAKGVTASPGASSEPPRD